MLINLFFIVSWELKYVLILWFKSVVSEICVVYIVIKVWKLVLIKLLKKKILKLVFVYDCGIM